MIWWSDCPPGIMQFSSYSRPPALCLQPYILPSWVCFVLHEDPQNFTALPSQSSTRIRYSLQPIFLHWIICLNPVQHLLFRSGLRVNLLLSIYLFSLFVIWSFWGFPAVSKWQCLTSDRCCNYRSNKVTRVQPQTGSATFAEDKCYSRLLPRHFQSFFSQSHPMV